MQRSPAAIPESETNPRTTILFSIADRVGALDEALQTLKMNGVNLTRIESRPSKTAEWDYDFFVDIATPENDNKLDSILKSLYPVVKNVKVVGKGPADLKVKTPWFPRKKSDLDSFAVKTLEYGAELDSDHPGFTDPSYRKRRAEITEIAKTHRQ